MQFAVPQFTDVEDKLIGPLTLKQFLMLLFTGGVVLMFWALFKLSIIFFLFALPVALLGILITFAKFNGRPFFSYLFPVINYLSVPKSLIYKREGIVVNLSKTAQPKKAGKQEAIKERLGGEAAASRLKKLAYLLDTKQQQEEELLEEDK